MANTINWEEAEKNAGGDFKNFYADGNYTAKCDGVEIKEVGTNGSVIMKFHFEEGTDGQFPTADHWLSFKNDNWRYIHNKRLMMLFGASEENAKKAVEMAENKSGKENIIKAYEACYNKLLAKKPEVEIEVFTEPNQSNGKEYARAEFRDRSVAMPHGDDNKPADKGDDVLSTGEEVDLTEADLPFN